MNPIRFRDYSLFVGDRPYLNIPILLRASGDLKKGVGAFDKSFVEPKDIADEEAQIACHGMGLSDLFERNRTPVRDELRAIVGFAFERFKIAGVRGIDIGSGATGEMVEELLPRTFQREWMQMELSEAGLAENRRRHPGSTIVQGSYLRMASGLENHFKVVTGLSSLDATFFLERALTQISQVLEVGGYLVHVQDVRPGAGFGVREAQRLGQKPPFVVELFNEEVVTHQLGDKFVDVGEIFRKQMGRALKAVPTMEVLMNHWVTVRKPRYGTPMSRWYFLNALFDVDVRNVNPQPMTDVTAVVTVARKK